MSYKMAQDGWFTCLEHPNHTMLKWTIGHSTIRVCCRKKVLRPNSKHCFLVNFGHEPVCMRRLFRGRMTDTRPEEFLDWSIFPLP